MFIKLIWNAFSQIIYFLWSGTLSGYYKLTVYCKIRLMKKFNSHGRSCRNSYDYFHSYSLRVHLHIYTVDLSWHPRLMTGISSIFHCVLRTAVLHTNPTFLLSSFLLQTILETQSSFFLFCPLFRETILITIVIITISVHKIRNSIIDALGIL